MPWRATPDGECGQAGELPLAAPIRLPFPCSHHPLLRLPIARPHPSWYHTISSPFPPAPSRQARPSRSPKPLPPAHCGHAGCQPVAQLLHARQEGAQPAARALGQQRVAEAVQHRQEGVAVGGRAIGLRGQGRAQERGQGRVGAIRVQG
jgi:hypothetical protein